MAAKHSDFISLRPANDNAGDRRQLELFAPLEELKKPNEERQ